MILLLCLPVSGKLESSGLKLSPFLLPSPPVFLWKQDEESPSVRGGCGGLREACLCFPDFVLGPCVHPELSGIPSLLLFFWRGCVCTLGSQWERWWLLTCIINQADWAISEPGLQLIGSWEPPYKMTGGRSSFPVPQFLRGMGWWWERAGAGAGSEIWERKMDIREAELGRQGELLNGECLGISINHLCWQVRLKSIVV